MGPLFKRLCVNNKTLLNKSGWKPLIARKSLTVTLHFQRITLWQSNSQSTRMLIKFILKSFTVVNKMTLVEGSIPSQVWIVTSVSEKVISKGIENPMEMFLMGIHNRI